MPRNPFNIGLGYARERGYPQETYDRSAPWIEGDGGGELYPGLTDGVRGVQDIHAASGDVQQDSAPEYMGEWHPGIQNIPGIVPSYTEQVPAPGSQSLSAPRNSGEIAGTNTLIKSDGPVRGDGADGGNTWTGQRDQAYKLNPQYNGPVSGFGARDYGTSVQLAYLASQAQQLSQSAMDSAMVSAV